MKTALILLSLAACLHAAPLIPVPSDGPPKPGPISAIFEWDKNLEVDLAGYRLYYGITSGEWPYKADAGPVTRAELQFPEPGTYFVVATAYNIAGLESLPSEELRVEIVRPGPVPPSMPSFFVSLQTSTDLKQWATVWQQANPAGNKGFYRIRFTSN